MEIRLQLRWSLGDKSAEELPHELIQLLDGIARAGNLRAAARDAKLSYRHAWGLLKHWEGRFGIPLVALEQGRGSDLTRAGELVREVWHKTVERTAFNLNDAAIQAGRQFSSLTPEMLPEQLAIAASHSFGVTVLVDLLRQAKLAPKVRFVGSEESLKGYADGECQVAGFHLPQGDHGRRLWSRFQPYLDARRDITVLVETRELGFMARLGTPRVDIARLASKKLRFQNRQAGAGSRLVFDLLLEEADLKPAAIIGYHNEEYTHVAVAAVIAGGEADAGFGARAAAEKFGLAFWPEVTEKYLLVMSREALRRKPLALIPRLLASQRYKHELGEIAGSNARGSGKQLDLKHVQSLIRLPRRAVRAK
ncbi:MAG: substrate-binding domain-containing protein [Gammaproteobacteria bacterium]